MVGAPKIQFRCSSAVEQVTVKRQPLIERLVENSSNSVKPKCESIRQYRAKPEREGVETRRREPKVARLWLWYSPESDESHTNL